MPFLDLVSIKSEATLRRVLDQLTWHAAFSKDGTQRGACPLHGSNSARSRSFAVTGEAWYCHKCKIGGDCIDLWKAYYHLDTYPAVLDLCDKLHVPVYEMRRLDQIHRARNGEEER